MKWDASGSHYMEDKYEQVRVYWECLTYIYEDVSRRQRIMDNHTYIEFGIC